MEEVIRQLKVNAILFVVLLAALFTCYCMEL